MEKVVTNMVISCVAYSCTNRQKTLFSGNLCCKCLCCVSVCVNECNSFEKVLKYQYITDTFVFLGGNVHSMFPSSHIDWVQHKMS